MLRIFDLPEAQSIRHVTINCLGLFKMLMRVRPSMINVALFDFSGWM